MFVIAETSRKTHSQDSHDPANLLSRVVDLFEKGKYSRVVESCREYLPENPRSIVMRLLYARALYEAGQIDSASGQFRRVLALDPENIVALKHLGDIKFAQGNEIGCLADYRKIFEIDPGCRGLVCDLKKRNHTETRTITLKNPVKVKRSEQHLAILQRIPFFTETVADLYLDQGHPRVAVDVYLKLMENNDNPRLAEKLSQARNRAKEKGL